MNGRHHKVMVSHLARAAYLYVRQATQSEGVECAKILRQRCDLQQQAFALGWTSDRVKVADSDVGQLGHYRVRAGFQKLLRCITQGRVGIVLGLDSSRLTRNWREWQRLLDSCASNDTLLLQQGTLFDPNDVNDRVLLGCKETTIAKPTRPSQEEKEALA